MNIAEQRHYKLAEKLLNLANDVLADSNGTQRIFNYDNPYHNPEFKKITKLEKKFKKSGRLGTPDVSDYLREFCIPFEYIPDRLYTLMQWIGWLDNDTHAPVPHLKGFYTDIYHDYIHEERTTKIWHYCTVDQYIELLYIDSQLQGFYNKNKEVA